MATSNSPTFMASEQTVTSAGTAVALSAVSQRVRSVTIIAKAGNVGQVYVGGADVDSDTNGRLDARESLVIPAAAWLDLTDIYIDADENDDGVDFYAVTA